MAEEPPKMEPSSAIMRENLVQTAIHFLQNPRVQSSPISQKRAFLIKKGLTSEEIDKAIDAVSLTSHQTAMVPQPYVTKPFKPSFWMLLNRYGSAAVLIGITIYGLHQFYKLYLEPMLYGTNKREDRLAMVEEQLIEVSRSLSQLKKSILTIEETLDLQKKTLTKTLSAHNAEADSFISPAVLLELKSDISIIKSLLLNRKQFPDVPKITPPTIPWWQKGGGDGNKPADENANVTAAAIIEDKSMNGVTENNSAIQNGVNSNGKLEDEESDENTETTTDEEKNDNGVESKKSEE